MNKLSSRGALNHATRSSRYLLTPLNQKAVRLGRRDRVSGGGCRLSLSGHDQEDRNSRERK